MNQQLIEKIVGEVLSQLGNVEAAKQHPANAIPIAVSARHIHLSQEHVEELFGAGYKLTKKGDLSQLNQFAANETVMIAGPRGSIERVRVLGPVRSSTQVEVSWTDAMKLGVKPHLRDSGNIIGSAPFTLVGPKGSLYLDEGLIIAQAHIHMDLQDAKRLNVEDGEYVTVEVDGVRPIAYRNVKIRVSERYRLEMHIDTDEANAGFIAKGTIGYISRPGEERTRLIEQDSLPVRSESKPHNYRKKLLSNNDIRIINETEIVIEKGTIVTPLARDTARELGKTISFRK
ncbi:phosphate propanoyltransferase [Neobacillus niacini]|uniref:phosphate propanoyltransferase n=1 Tax=Neobacillus niacini TaxID=86668 RepID=UPI00203E0AE2|nr:phosphate propanoyltransferase [Neobacillus niacini]MCM3691939.1 phosphate propanoyltransferase [Neobacillus niacini]